VTAAVFGLAAAEWEAGPGDDVFAKLGYEPNCRPRYEVRQQVAARLGIDSPFDPRVTDAAGPELPPPCGQCPQELFHAATEWDVLFGGSSGGGKSVALVGHAIRECVRCPGLRVGAFRRTYPELRESLLAELATTFGFGQGVGAAWNGTEHELRLPNGSLIMFRYAETLKDATRRQGGSYQLVIFDERTLLGADVCAFLESRLRSGRAEIPVLGIRSSANPGGVSHSSVKARYITGTDYGRSVYRDERGRSVRFVPSKLDDNPHVNPEYAADLRALPEQMRAAFLDGNWDVFAGMMYPEISREQHVVEPFPLPESWRRYVGIDWGYTNPFAAVFGCEDPDGRVYCYRVLSAAGVGEAEQARRILAAQAPGERIATYWADDAIFASRGGDVLSVADTYRANGVYVVPAHKSSRVIGWQRVRSYLAEMPACLEHRSAGLEVCPRLHIFSTAGEVYRTLAELPRAVTGDPEDAASDGDDHIPDALRYLLLNLGGGSAEQWIAWARRKALEAGAIAPHGPGALPEPQPQGAIVPAASPEPEPEEDVPLEGVVLDPVAARKRARDEMFRNSAEGRMLARLGR